MTAPRAVISPGKLVLVGEYAVLDGAPAVVLAIDRGVMCQVWPDSTLRIETPRGDDRFVRPALEGRRGRFVFSDWNPVPGPGKPGFGGSAAACVAACVASGRPATDALAIHHTVQGGGSGIDVAASIHGGMLRFQQGVCASLPAVVPSVIWTGRSAKTSPRVAAYRAWRDRQAFTDQSAVLVDGFASDPVRVLAEAGALLEDMARRAGLEGPDVGYLTPELIRVRDLARAHGGAGKPSGAGGGDSAVAVFYDADAQQAFEAACGREGLTPIAVRACGGARVVDDPDSGAAFLVYGGGH